MVDIFWREVVRSARRAVSSACVVSGSVLSVAVVRAVARKDLREGVVA